MTLPPQKFREIVFQLVYSQVVSGEEEEIVPFLMAEFKVTRRAVREAKERAQKILEKLPEIDPLIEKTSTSYSFERISTVEKCILRLSSFELLFDPTLPHPVVMAEAVRLGRKFGSPEGAQFVNAVLDEIYRGIQTPSSPEPLPL